MRELACTRIVEYRERNKKSKWIIVHRRCGRQAAEVTLSGHLIKARAMLCEEHLGWAMREIELSGNSYPMLFHGVPSFKDPQMEKR